MTTLPASMTLRDAQAVLESLRASFAANTAIKFAAGVSP